MDFDKRLFAQLSKEELLEQYHGISNITEDAWHTILDEYGKLFFFLLEDREISNALKDHREVMKRLNKMKLYNDHQKEFKDESELLAEMSMNIRYDN